MIPPAPGRRGQAWWGLASGSLGLAALSLVVLPRSLAYDPWSWLIWGREIIHLNLDTRLAATAVKPLPMLLDALFALAGSSAAPILWLLVARAATLLSLGLAFRVGRRLAGVGAGLIAAAVLAISDEYLGYLFMRGMSEPAAAAALLAAVDCHLSRQRRGTLAWLVVVGLLRPECWPVLFLYCLWLARTGSLVRRLATVTLAVVVPASWFVLDWLGSGQLSRSANAAKHTSQGGPLLSRQPGLATFRETWHLMSGPVVVLFLAAAAWSVWESRRARRVQAALWLSVGAVAWLVIDAVLAQGRLATGAPRYLLPGVGLAGVVIGIVAAQAVSAVARALPGRRVAVLGAGAMAVALAGVMAPRIHAAGHQVRTGISLGRTFARTQSGLHRVVALAGGRANVVRCGFVATQAFEVPLVAWDLHQHVGDVGIVVRVPGTVLQARGEPKPPDALSDAFRLLGSTGPPASRWAVLSTCPPVTAR